MTMQVIDGMLKYAISDGMRYDYTYYEDGYLKEKSASGKRLLHFEYDLNGNRIMQQDLTGKVTRYQYNILDRLEEVYDNEKRIASYEYYSDGSLKSIHAGQDLNTQYTYDSERNLSSLQVELGGEKLVENLYEYDGNGNRTKIHGLMGNTTYCYDKRNQLVKATYPKTSEELFYDNAGNRIKRVAGCIEESYNYDERNRLIRQTFVNIQDQTVQKVKEFVYDNQGNMTQDDQAKYTFDAFNRVVKVEKVDGQIQINQYDAENLRYEVEENERLVSFLFCDREVIVEKREDNVTRYIREQHVLIASDSENARTYYHYVSDEKGSVTHIIGDDREILNWYQYDAFGNVIDCEEKIENRFRYCGQQWDRLTEQYYLRSRYYNPVIARFTQEDTYRGDGLNLYTYCGNNPVTYWDPSGNVTKEECRANEASKDKKSTRKEEQRRVWKEYTGTEPTGEVHHGLPEKFKDWFKSRGIDINSGEYYYDLPKDIHRLKDGNGIHTNNSSLGENWNKIWEKYIAQNPNASKQQILNKLEQMEKTAGIGKYRAVKKS